MTHVTTFLQLPDVVLRFRYLLQGAVILNHHSSSVLKFQDLDGIQGLVDRKS